MNGSAPLSSIIPKNVSGSSAWLNNVIQNLYAYTNMEPRDGIVRFWLAVDCTLAGAGGTGGFSDVQGYTEFCDIVVPSIQLESAIGTCVQSKGGGRFVMENIFLNGEYPTAYGILPVGSQTIAATFNFTLYIPIYFDTKTAIGKNSLWTRNDFVSQSVKVTRGTGSVSIGSYSGTLTVNSIQLNAWTIPNYTNTSGLLLAHRAFQVTTGTNDVFEGQTTGMLYGYGTSLSAINAVGTSTATYGIKRDADTIIQNGTLSIPDQFNYFMSDFFLGNFPESELPKFKVRLIHQPGMNGDPPPTGVITVINAASSFASSRAYYGCMLVPPNS